MKAIELIEVLDAAAISSYVESPFPQRGAIMIVGPPSSLKTSIITMALQDMPNKVILSDLNVNSLMDMREALISGRYSTIAFPEFEKLYMRKADTASNVEGSIKQLIEEGFTRASFEEQDAISFTARALVIGAMTHSFYNSRIAKWRESGFKRRILWLGVRLRDPDQIMESVHKWARIQLDGIPRRYPVQNIPYNLTDGESKYIQKMLEGQWEVTPYVLLKKILCVLKWKYPKEADIPMHLMKQLRPLLNNQMGEIEI